MRSNPEDPMRSNPEDPMRSNASNPRQLLMCEGPG